MAKICIACGRGPVVGASRSHSNIKSKKWVYPNLQWRHVEGKRVRICTNCIKTKVKKVK